MNSIQILVFLIRALKERSKQKGNKALSSYNVVFVAFLIVYKRKGKERNFINLKVSSHSSAGALLGDTVNLVFDEKGKLQYPANIIPIQIIHLAKSPQPDLDTTEMI